LLLTEAKYINLSLHYLEQVIIHVILNCLVVVVVVVVVVIVHVAAAMTGLYLGGREEELRHVHHTIYFSSLCYHHRFQGTSKN